MTYFRSGFKNSYWRYSGQSVHHQFLVSHPEEVEYRVFSQHCGRVVERFFNTDSVAIGKFTGLPTVAIQDVVENVNQIVQRNPHIFLRHLSQQMGRSQLTIKLVPSHSNSF
jgi:hypothetical protein